MYMTNLAAPEAASRSETPADALALLYAGHPLDEAQAEMLFGALVRGELDESAIAAMDGVKSTSLQRMQAARALGASEWQVFRYVVFPSALHEIFTGARLAIGVVYATLIAAEIIAGSTGLGWMILDAGRFLRSDYVFVGISFIGLMGLLLDRLLLAVEHRIVHWAGKA